MPLLSDASFVWTAIAAQCLGLLSLIAARASQGSWAQGGFQLLFFLCLLTVALATAVAWSGASPLGLPCAATFSVMTVGATLDMRRTVLESSV